GNGLRSFGPEIPGGRGCASGPSSCPPVFRQQVAGLAVGSERDRSASPLPLPYGDRGEVPREAREMTPFFRFPRTAHLVWLGEGQPRDDKVLLPSDAEALLAGSVVVEEKIDGANIGFSV